MKLTFKDVGQGDSIILEWQNTEKRSQVGLIDCNKKNESNPVLSYLSQKFSFDLKFIVLTHPHDDHFSGMLELLDFIQNRKLQVEYFLHTCFSTKEYLTASVKSVKSRSLLLNIFRKANDLYESGLIAKYGAVNDLTGDIQLTDKVFLKFLFPNHKFINLYNRVAFKNLDIKINNPNANLLCTVIKIYSDGWYALLTADANKAVFKMINRKGYSSFVQSFILGQVPHHGSDLNYYDTFWKLIPSSDQTFACISVGKNSYGHPGKEAIRKLKEHSYKVEQTADMTTDGLISTSIALDAISVLIDPIITSSFDLSYELKIPAVRL